MSAAWRTVFDIPRKKEEILKLEKEMGSADFWKDRDKSREAPGRMTELKEETIFWEKLDEKVKYFKKLLNAPYDQEKVISELDALERQLLAEEKKVFLGEKYDKNDAILTFFAGAGGDDAEDWAAILLKMYKRYGEKKGWKVDILHRHASEHGGIKNATLEIIGKYAYGYLKNETGVHRLVRISPFSAKKLRHTSFVMLQVLPKIAESKDVIIKEENLKIDFSRSSGPGGQNVNKRETAVRITHLPTGIQVHVDSERSQLQNRQRALEILRSKLYQYERVKKEEEKELLRGKIIEAAWGYQIRSYVFHPYQMVKDHRTGIETSDVESVLDGELDKFIEAELKNYLARMTEIIRSGG